MKRAPRIRARPTQAVPKNSVPNHAYPYTAVSFAVSVLCTTALSTGNAPNVKEMEHASPTPSPSEALGRAQHLATLEQAYWSQRNCWLSMTVSPVVTSFPTQGWTFVYVSLDAPPTISVRSGARMAPG